MTVGVTLGEADSDAEAVIDAVALSVVVDVSLGVVDAVAVVLFVAVRLGDTDTVRDVLADDDIVWVAVTVELGDTVALAESLGVAEWDVDKDALAVTVAVVETEVDTDFVAAGEVEDDQLDDRLGVPVCEPLSDGVVVHDGDGDKLRLSEADGDVVEEVVTVVVTVADLVLLRLIDPEAVTVSDSDIDCDADSDIDVLGDTEGDKDDDWEPVTVDEYDD